MSSTPASSPEQILAAYIAGLDAGSDAEFEGILARHPEFESELRELYSRWVNASQLLQDLGLEHGAEGSRRSTLPDPLPGAGPGVQGNRDSPRSAFAAPADGSAAVEPIAPSVRAGAVIGDFLLVEFLGRGGMGQVWEADQLSLSRKVALKLLLPDRIATRSLEFFEREARAGARLTHPGIVSVYDTGEENGLAWIAMELVEGGLDLRRAIDDLRESGPLPDDYYDQLARLVIGLADALEHAHAAGIIHRDLKPGNVLISKSEQPKVADFGLAKVLDERSLSMDGDLVGTWYYMSPEQVAAKRAGIDHRTDVFSLGVILYELLTLQRPFEGDTTQQVARQILMRDPPDPRILRSKVPRDLSVICLKALEKDVERRFQSMAEFAADLRRHLAHEPIHALPPTAVQRGVKWVRRNPTRSAVAAVVVAALIAITSLWLRAKEAESEAADVLVQVQAEKAASLAALEVAQLRAYSMNIHAAAAAMELGDHQDARRRLDACPESRQGWEWRHLDLTQDSSLLTLRGHGGSVDSVAWNAAETRIVSGSQDSSVRIWDAKTGEVRHVLTGHVGPVWSVAWNPAGTRVVSGSYDDTLRIWNAETGKLLHTLTGHTSDVVSVAWNASGTRIASGSLDRTLRIWDAETGTGLHTLKGHLGDAKSVAWSPTGTRIASGSTDKSLRIWDAETGASLRTLEGHPGAVASIAWSPSGTRIVSGAVDKTLRIWDAETGASLRTLAGHEEYVRCVAWSPAGTRVVSGSTDNTLRIWDAETGDMLQTLAGHENEVHAVSWSPSGTRVVSGSMDHTLRIWDATTGASQHALAGHRREVAAVSWNPTGSRIVSGSTDKTLRIWDAETGTSLQALTGHQDFVWSAAWSPSGTRIVSASADKTLRIWDAMTGESLLALAGHELEAMSVAWSPDETRVVSGSHDNTLRIWDVETGASLRTLTGHVNGVKTVAWSPTGTHIASGSLDETLRIWDAETGEVVHTLKGQGGFVWAVAWNPLGTQVVSGSADTNLRIWDVSSGECLRTLEGHTQIVRSVAWNPGGARILSGSADNSMRIWSAESGESLQTLTGHAGAAWSVAWNPTGTRIVSGSLDRTVRIWESRLQDALPMWRAASQRQAVRPLVDALFEEHVLLAQVLTALQVHDSFPDDLRAIAVQLAHSRGDPAPVVLNDHAWILVDPDRKNLDTDVELALRLARAAVKLAPDEFAFHDTLAWSLFANGQFDESLEASQGALMLVTEDRKDEFRGYLERLRRMTAEGRQEPAPLQREESGER